MSLEQELQNMTAAVTKLNDNFAKYGAAILKGAGGGDAPAAEEKPAKATKEKPAKVASKHTEESVKAKIKEVIAKHDQATAKELLTEAGVASVAKLIEAPALWDDFVVACDAKLADDDGMDGL